MDQEIKKDAGKNRLDLIPVECIDAIGEVLTFGAEKYHDHSWREGINYSRVYGAAQRHLQAFWGEALDIDGESELSHLSHAFCNIAFLLTYEANKERYRTFDDRAGSCNSYFKNQQDNVDTLLNMVNDNQGFFNHGPDKTCLEAVIEVLKNAIQDKKFPDLTEMSHPEACKHLEKGMLVRVIRAAKTQTKGWKNSWIAEYMDSFIGREYTINRIYEDAGVFFKESCFSFPAFVLEIVDGEK